VVSVGYSWLSRFYGFAFASYEQPSGLSRRNAVLYSSVTVLTSLLRTSRICASPPGSVQKVPSERTVTALSAPGDTSVSRGSALALSLQRRQALARLDAGEASREIARTFKCCSHDDRKDSYRPQTARVGRAFYTGRRGLPPPCRDRAQGDVSDAVQMLGPLPSLSVP
jgi:hypothetical protein